MIHYRKLCCVNKVNFKNRVIFLIFYDVIERLLFLIQFRELLYFRNRKIAIVDAVE